MKKLILDTSILIDHLRRKDRVHTILAEITRAGYEGAISIITHTELYAGKSVWQDESLKMILDKLCSGFNIIQIDIHLSESAGKIRAYYNLSLGDSIIAATAIENDYELVTLNEKDFKKIPDLKLFNSQTIKSSEN